MIDPGGRWVMLTHDATQVEARQPASALASRRAGSPAPRPAPAQDGEARHGEAAGPEDEEEEEEAAMNMKLLLFLIAVAAGAVAISWPTLATLAMLVALVCGFLGLAYVVLGTRGVAPPRRAEELDTRDVWRDMPPPPST